MGKETRESLVHAAIAAAAVAVRLAYLLPTLVIAPAAFAPVLDAEVVWSQSESLAALFPAEAFHQAPLYPILVFLARRLTGSLRSVLLVQIALDGVQTYLVCRIARRYGSWPARSAGLVYALAPAPAFFGTRLLSTTLAGALTGAWLLGTGWLLDAPSRGRAIAAGAVTAILVLNRPSDLLLVLLVPMLARSARVAIPFVLAAALGVLPATIYNATRERGLVVVSWNMGETFYHGNNPNADGGIGEVDELSMNIVTQAAEARQAASIALGRRATASETNRFFFGKGLRFLTGNPGRAARLVAAKALRVVSPTDYPAEYDLAMEIREIPSILRFLPFRGLLLLVLWSAGLALLLADGAARRLAISRLLLAHAACQVAVMLVFFVFSRYRMALFPAQAVLAGIALARIAGAARARALRPIAAPLAAAAAASAAIALGTSREEVSHAMFFHNLATHEAEAGRRERAIALEERAIQEDPRRMHLYRFLAQQDATLGRSLEALQAIDRALAVVPETADARNDRGTFLAALGRREEALADYRRASELDPMSPLPWCNAALMFIDEGRKDDARTAVRRALEVSPGFEPALELAKRLGP